MTTTENGIVSDFTLGQNYNSEGNANFSQLRRSASPEWANKVSTTTALTYGYFGGQAWTGSAWSTVADGTTSLTDNTTNYVERTAAGTVSVASTNFTASKIPMAIVVTLSGAITTHTDARREQVPSGAAFTTEDAQDAVGAMVDSTLVYTDATPLLSRAALTGVVTASAGSNTTAMSSDVALPGNPTTTTQSAGNNTTRIATTAFVTTAVAGVSGALADGDYGDITVSGSGTVLNIDAGVVTGTEIATDVALAGNPTTTTQSVGNSTTRIATTAFVAAAVTAGGAPSWVSNNPLTSADSQSFIANDNFDTGSSIDTGGTRFTGAAAWSTRLTTGLTTAVADGVLTLTLPQTASDIWEGYTQVLPAGDCRYRTQLYWDGLGVNYHSVGVVVERGTGGSRKSLVMSIGWNPGFGNENHRIDRLSTDSDTYSASPFSDNNPTYDTIKMPWCFEIEYNSTNIIFKSSQHLFHRLRTVLTEAQATWLGGRADRIGVVVHNAAPGNGDCNLHSLGWWRVT